MIRFTVFARLAGGLVVLIGLLALAGWAFDIPALKTILPGLAPMKANAAICFILAGLSLLAQARVPARPGEHSRLAQALAVVVTGIGVLTLAEYAANRNLGFNVLLFSEAARAAGLSFPVRMAPAAGLNFILLGIALLSLDVKTRRTGIWPAQHLTLTAGGVTLLAFIGYCYRVEPQYQIGPYASMALHSTFAFWCLGLGILLARPDRGVMAVLTGDNPGGWLARRMIPAVILIPLLAGWLAEQGERAGRFTLGFGAALLATTVILAFGALAAWAARSLNRVDAERRRAGEALRQSEERLRLFIATAPAAIAMFDRQMRYVAASEAWLREHGLHGEVVGTSHYDLVPWLPEKWKQSHQRALAGSVEGCAEDRWVRPDGSTAWAKWEVRPWLATSGETGGVVVFAEDITLRKVAEEALRASEQRLRLFIATAPVAIAMFDRRMCYVAASQLWLKEHSLSGDVAGICHYDAFPSMPEEWKRAHERTLAGAVERCAEERWVRPDGTAAWTKWEMRPWFGAAGEIGGLVIFIEDITVAKAAQAGLRDSQERETARRLEMEALMAAAPVIVWIAHDPECRVITGNRTGEAMLRVPAGGNLSKTAPEAERPGQFQVFQDGRLVPDRELSMQVAGRTGKPVLGVEQEIRYADGTSRWVYGNAVPLLKADGTVRGVVATFLDITERRRMEETLRSTEAQLRLVADITAVSLVRCSRDQRYLFVNRAYANMLGLKPEDIVGQPVAEILGPAGYEAIRPYIETVLQGRPVEFEVEMPYATASRRRLRVFYVPHRNEQGEVLGWVASISDISDWKRVEAELQASRKQLRTLAARLQEVREEERARLAREIHDVLAQELTRIKMDIVWLNRRLAQPVDAAQQPLLLEKLAAMTELANTAIGSVQKIATELRPVVLDSFGLCAAIEWQVKDFGARSGIRCVAHVPARDFPLDRERSTAMFRILQESLTNVARHAAATTLEVHLFGNEEAVTLTVRDNGRGIEAAQLNDPHAMGLLGMRERAALLGGDCTITREAAGGTLVEARLPLPPGAAGQEEKS